LPENPEATRNRLQIAAAKRMSEEDRMTIQEVEFAVGYEDAAFVRGLFKRYARISPSAYRERYGQGEARLH
jgi:transcriptional regulator GlxA family with amidase domain